MNSLIVDAARDKIFLTHIVDKNIYTCSHENSKINFEKMIVLIENFLKTNKSSLKEAVDNATTTVLVGKEHAFWLVGVSKCHFC